MLRVTQLSGFGGRRSSVSRSLTASAGSFLLSGTAATLWNSSAPDPYIADVVLLLNPAGADASTTVTDASPAAHGTATVTGNAQIDTGVTDAGKPTMLFDGAGDAFGWSDSADWNLGSGHYCVEARVRYNSLTGQQFIVGQWNTSGDLSWVLSKATTGTDLLNFNYSTTGSNNVTVTGAWSPSTGTWYDVAVNYDGNKIRLFVDGVMVGSSTVGAITLFDSPNALAVGSNSSVSNFFMNGWISRLRVTKGNGRGYGDAGYAVQPAGYFPTPAHATISADAGAFALSGAAAALTKTYSVSADAGAFSLSGVAATLTKSSVHIVLADAGSFALSGTAASPTRALKTSAGAGSFVLTGTAATLTKPTWVTAFSDTLNTNDFGWGGYTLRIRLAASQITGSGSNIRLTLEASSVANCSFDAAYVGHSAGSGDPYDMDGNQVQLLVGGSGSFTILSGATALTDSAAFAYDETRDLILSLHTGVATSLRARNGAGAGTVYYKSGVNEAATSNVSGYSTVTDQNLVVNKIEVS